jgi:hypothetical protein
MRVPGGWNYIYYSGNGVVSTQFVPMHTEFAEINTTSDWDKEVEDMMVRIKEALSVKPMLYSKLYNTFSGDIVFTTAFNLLCNRHEVEQRPKDHRYELANTSI